ncbi:CAP domain-containing protein [Pseudonocardia phyllosphaerae]|uniref:CAP domain-containing protein n=1 Tax=Pseudonocardia phyllosphaerae TaxID=3390502 RepID=UPI00397D074C
MTRQHSSRAGRIRGYVVGGVGAGAVLLALSPLAGLAGASPDPAASAHASAAASTSSSDTLTGDVSAALPTAEPLPGAPEEAAPKKAAQEQTAPEKTGQAPKAGDLPGRLAEVVTLTNAQRKIAGCGNLTPDARLDKAAQGHSDEMARTGTLSHDSADGRSFADRITAAGYPSPGAENVAQGQPDAATVVKDWMNSEGHRRNILDCSLTTIGVGESGGYWTQDFGR